MRRLASAQRTPRVRRAVATPRPAMATKQADRRIHRHAHARPTRSSRRATASTVSAGALLLAGGLALLATAGIAMVAPSLLRRDDRLVVAIALVAAAVGGALAPGAPTGIDGLDAVLRVVAALALVVATVAATPGAWLLATAVVAVPSLAAAGVDGSGVWAWVALGVTTAAFASGNTGRDLGALVGLAIGQAALRLAWPHTNGGSALVGVVALAIVAVPAYLSTRGVTRRRATIALLALGGVGLFVVGAYGIVVLSAKSDIDRGVDESNAAIDAIRHGDSLQAAAHFDAAHDAFASAHDRLSGWWTAPPRVLPVPVQQARALDVLSDTGADLAAASARTARDADVASVKLVHGAVPIEKLRNLEALLVTALGNLRHARA